MRASACITCVFLCALHPQMHVCGYINACTHRYLKYCLLLKVLCNWKWTMKQWNSNFIYIYSVTELGNSDKNVKIHSLWEKEQHWDELLPAPLHDHRELTFSQDPRQSRTPCWCRFCLLWTRSLHRIKARRKNCSAEVNEALKAIF